MWNSDTSELTMYICRGTSLRAYESISITFDVTNAPEEQASPSIVLAGTGPVALTSVQVAKPGVAFLGVPNGTDPLEIVSPVFLTKDMGQTTPFSGLANVIALTLQVNNEIKGSDLSVITLTGLIGDFFSNADEVDFGVERDSDGEWVTESLFCAGS